MSQKLISKRVQGDIFYFPLRVIPMLPEVISNNLCSLVPNQERLVLACDVQISKHGEINHSNFMRQLLSRKKGSRTTVFNL